MEAVVAERHDAAAGGEGEDGSAGEGQGGEEDEEGDGTSSEEVAKLAQKLGQLQPFVAVCLLKCMGQLASFGPT
jgi:hypothetical protein